MRQIKQRPGAGNTRGAERGLPTVGETKFTSFDLFASREIDRLIVAREEQATRIDWLEAALLHAAGRPT